jgi:hypothetical protein
MSFAPNEYLTSNPTENLRCRQHASKTFVTDQFRLLPKDKFLFHVAFNINWQGINPTTVEAKLLHTLKNEINLLVKSIDLPTYTVSAETLNQYNRKRVVQYQHKYNDVKVSFHDDNMGLINQLWQTYYKYYYNDPTVSSKKGSYIKNAMKESSYITSPYGFMGRVKPFFNYIMIYQMSRHEYVSYKLVNPLITHWGGNNLAYHSGESHSFEMTLAYEAVSYGTGYVNDGQMEDFLSSHYDLSPSTLTSSYPANSGSYPAFAKSNFSLSNAISAAASSSAINAAGATTIGSTTGLTTGSTAKTSISGVSIPVSTTGTTNTVGSPITTNTGTLVKL